MALLNLLHVYLNLPWAGCTCSLHDFCILTCSDVKCNIKRNDTLEICNKCKQHTDSSWKANRESSLPARKSYLLIPSREEVQIQDTKFNKPFSKTEKNAQLILNLPQTIKSRKCKKIRAAKFTVCFGRKGLSLTGKGFVAAVWMSVTHFSHTSAPQKAEGVPPIQAASAGLHTPSSDFHCFSQGEGFPALSE